VSTETDTEDEIAILRAQVDELQTTLVLLIQAITRDSGLIRPLPDNLSPFIAAYDPEWREIKRKGFGDPEHGNPGVEALISRGREIKNRRAESPTMRGDDTAPR
jgi:hypothetical protein